MIDVLLINPNPPSSIISIPSIPIGIAQLASCLEKEGIEVKILDLNVTDINRKKALKRSLRLNPKIVGISAASISIPEAVVIAKEVKKSTNADIVIGGRHVSADVNFIKEFKDVFDYEVIGEGELSFTSLVKQILKGKKLKKRMIVGLPLKNIKSLPPLAYHLLPMEKYKKTGFVILSSRGCLYRCIYCSIGPSKVRFKNPKVFVKEVEFLKDKYNIDKIAFCDANFTINNRHAQEICSELVKQNVDMRWSIQTRVDLVNKHTFELMKRAGCELVQFGVESFSDDVQIETKKNITLNMTSCAVKVTKNIGLKVGMNLMFGLPTEKKRDISRTVNILNKLKPNYASVCFAVPFPGTELFNIAIQNGLDKRIWYKYARGKIQSLPFCLSNDISKIYYLYYFNKVSLSFPSLSFANRYPGTINWLIANNIKILFPRLSSLLLKALRKDSTISETFENFFKKVSIISNTYY